MVGFNNLLENRAFLAQFSETRERGEWRFNRLLAYLATTHDRAAALAELEKLQQATDVKSDVRAAMEGLKRDLTHPLRRLKF